MKIVLEIFLAVVVLIGGYTYWAIKKKNRFLRSRLKDEEFLRKFLRELHEQESFSSRTKEFEPIGYGYFENLGLISRGTAGADKIIERVSLILSLIALGVSGFLGWIYITINLALYLLVPLLPLEQAGVRNALTTVVELAQVLYKWNKEKPSECAEFIDDAHSLALLYGVVKNLE